MKSDHIRKVIEIRMMAILCLAALTACSGHSGKMATQGAASGAVIGAVGGLVT